MGRYFLITQVSANMRIAALSQNDDEAIRFVFGGGGTAEPVNFIHAQQKDQETESAGICYLLGGDMIARDSEYYDKELASFLYSEWGVFEERTQQPSPTRNSELGKLSLLSGHRPRTAALVHSGANTTTQFSHTTIHTKCLLCPSKDHHQQQQGNQQQQQWKH